MMEMSACSVCPVKNANCAHGKLGNGSQSCLDNIAEYQKDSKSNRLHEIIQMWAGKSGIVVSPMRRHLLVERILKEFKCES